MALTLKSEPRKVGMSDFQKSREVCPDSTEAIEQMLGSNLNDLLVHQFKAQDKSAPA